MFTTALQQRPALILIADDDLHVRQSLRHLLNDEHYDVVEAGNGIDAFHLFLEVQPDLVMLDARMPDYADGLDVCRKIQESSHNPPPVIMITAVADESFINQAFEAGAADYVTKPVNWAILGQRVRRLIKSRQLERFREDMFQMLVHDMKNPLTVIRGYAEQLLMDMKKQDDSFVPVSRIYQSSAKLLDMAMMILDISKMEEGRLQLNRTERNVLHVLKDIQPNFDLMAGERNVHIEIQAPQPDLTAKLDWSFITRVLVNIISNAIKHSPLGGLVSIAYHTTESGMLSLAVQDHGDGIDEEDQPFIFDKFTQQRERKTTLDTGLGLAFCKMVVQAHYGEIQVQSQSGMGSTFTILVPLNTEIAPLLDGVAQNEQKKNL